MPISKNPGNSGDFNKSAFKNFFVPAYPFERERLEALADNGYLDAYEAARLAELRDKSPRSSKDLFLPIMPN